MIHLFEVLEHTLDGGGWLGLLAAFGWGMIGVALSPCSIASISALVGFLSGEERHTRARATYLSLLFGIGMLLAFAVVGVVTACLGRILGDTGPVPAYVIALLLVLMALELWGFSIIPWSTPKVAAWGWRGPGAAIALGAVLGVALGPCTFSFAAPVLAAVFTDASAHLLKAAGLLLAFSVGHCAVLVVVGAFAGLAERWADRASASKVTGWLRKVCAIIVLIGAVWIVIHSNE